MKLSAVNTQTESGDSVCKVCLQANFDILKFILGWLGGIKQKKLNVLVTFLSLKMISFVLFPQVSEPSMNFNISKMVYYSM